MSLFSTVKQKVAAKLLGELITDLSTFEMDETGRQISLSIRQHSGKKPHLQVKYKHGGETSSFPVDCTRAWADQLERVAHEMRKHLDTK